MKKNNEIAELANSLENMKKEEWYKDIKDYLKYLKNK